MESMPMSEYGLKNLDYFMASCIEKLMYGKKTKAPPSWILWEAGCLPATCLLNIASLRLHNRLKKLSVNHSIAKKTLDSLKDNFFHERIHDCHNFISDELMEEIRSPDHITKTHLNRKMMCDFENWQSDNLPHSTQIPTTKLQWLKPSITIDETLINLPTKLRECLLQARATAYFDPSTGDEAKQCYLCGQGKLQTYQHLLLNCSYKPIAMERKKVDDLMIPSSLSGFWKDLDNDEKTDLLLFSHWSGYPIIREKFAIQSAKLNQEILKVLEICI
jgi:hypothetical protein